MQLDKVLHLYSGFGKLFKNQLLNFFSMRKYIFTLLLLFSVITIGVSHSGLSTDNDVGQMLYPNDQANTFEYVEAVKVLDIYFFEIYSQVTCIKVSLIPGYGHYMVTSTSHYGGLSYVYDRYAKDNSILKNTKTRPGLYAYDRKCPYDYGPNHILALSYYI